MPLGVCLGAGHGLGPVEVSPPASQGTVLCKLTLLFCRLSTTETLRGLQHGTNCLLPGTHGLVSVSVPAPCFEFHSYPVSSHDSSRCETCA